MQIPEWFLTNISQALNAYLHLDDASLGRFAALENKTVIVELTPLQLSFLCRFTDKGVSLEQAKEEIADARISGTPLQLLAMFLTSRDRQRFFADDITITGDAVLGQQVMHLFDELDIDWEEYLSRLIGDVPAYHIGRTVQSFSDKLKQVKTKFDRDITDYLHEEIEWFPSREALQDLFFDIDNLRMETDRIAARIQLLEETLSSDSEEEALLTETKLAQQLLKNKGSQ